MIRILVDVAGLRDQPDRRLRGVAVLIRRTRIPFGRSKRRISGSEKFFGVPGAGGVSFVGACASAAAAPAR